jgi:membrane protein YqaA with SNARE-associated domain
VHSILHTLDGFGGIYVAMFLFAILSGVFPLASAEAAMVALAVGSSYAVPKLIALAVVTALGQSLMHATLYFSARGLADAGAKRRPRLEARIAKARAIGAKWQKSELLMIALGATVGLPPQLAVAVFAGVIGIRFSTFVSIDVPGRIARFVTIVMVAHFAS